MKYLLSFLLLFVLSNSATIDITNTTNPVSQYCKNNGGTFIPATQKCSFAKDNEFDAWPYWENGIDTWDGDDFNYYNDNYNDHYNNNVNRYNRMRGNNNRDSHQKRK